MDAQLNWFKSCLLNFDAAEQWIHTSYVLCFICVVVWLCYSLSVYTDHLGCNPVQGFDVRLLTIRTYVCVKIWEGFPLIFFHSMFLFYFNFSCLLLDFVQLSFSESLYWPFRLQPSPRLRCSTSNCTYILLVKIWEGFPLIFFHSMFPFYFNFSCLLLDFVQWKILRRCH